MLLKKSKLSFSQIYHLSCSTHKFTFFYRYYEKTGNEWEDKDEFEKRPGKFFPVDIDDGDDDGVSNDIEQIYLLFF